jgi:hypothetical protein
MKRVASQHGIIGPLFAILVVPILSLSLLIGVEIGGVMSMARALETRLDRIALLVGRHLPDSSAAAAAANYEMLQLGERTGRGCTSIVPSVGEIDGGIVLTAECLYVPAIAVSLGFGTTGWRFTIRSEVVRAATDLMLIIDSSAYLGPQAGAVWGNEPASTFFREMYSNDSEARIRTQRCNNPVVRGIKRFALAAYPKFMKAHGNRLGVGFFPGSVIELVSVGGGSPYLALAKQLDDQRVSEGHYAGVFGSDHECRQVAEFEFDHRELFGLPEFALNDSSGLGAQIWGKVLSDSKAELDGNTWKSLMEGFRYGASGSPTGDVFGADRELNIIVLAGDVPRNGGERFPWVGGINDEDRDEYLRFLGGGRNVNLLYLIYAPSDLETGLTSINERATKFSDALKGAMGSANGRLGWGSFKSFVGVYREESSFLKDGLDLVRRNAGSIALRSLQ